MMPPPTTSPPTPRRLDSLHRVLIVLVLVAGVVGGVSGYLLGRAAIREASLLVSVMNEMPGTITVQLFLNGDPAGSLQVEAGMTSSVTIPVEFATSHAMFEVRGVPSSGGTDTDRVIVAATQTGFLELRIN